MSYKNILVMTDFSSFSAEAVKQAAFLASVSGCPLTVLHVAHDKSQFQIYLTDEQYSVIREKLKKEIEEKFISMETEIEELKKIRWSSIVRRGVPYIEGLYEADKGIYDLLVIGSHGESGFKRFAFGSTAAKILSHSPISVLITRVG